MAFSRLSAPALALLLVCHTSAEDSAATNGDSNATDLTYQEAVYDTTGTTSLPTDGFVKTAGNEFVIDSCGNFVFAGPNIWQAVELASNTQVNRGNPLPGRQHLTNIFNRMVDSGLTVMRIWGHTIVEGRELQPSPGEYSEEIFEGLDWILDECSERGLKVIIIFADNWYEIGGVDQYAKWSGGDFFDAPARELYKQNMKAMVERTNSINGRVYRDDPTIMAWNLANELRCKGCGDEVIQGWLEEMCGYLKGVDPNHIIGAGIEGFYGQTSEHKDSNPADWAANEGQNFLENNKIWCIDYAGMHVWPDNWEMVTKEFQESFIREGIKNAEELGKPVVLEEFGKVRSTGTRNEYFDSAFAVVEESVTSGGPLRGALFYHWYDDGIGPGSYGVWYDEETFQRAIKDNAAFMQEQSAC